MSKKPHHHLPIESIEQARNGYGPMKELIDEKIENAVKDLLVSTNGAKLHIEGDLTKEYLSMLALYALYREREQTLPRAILNVMSTYELTDGFIEHLRGVLEKGGVK